jgi:hypothetical protein
VDCLPRHVRPDPLRRVVPGSRLRHGVAVRPATLPASAGLQVKTGVIGWLAEGAAQATGGDPLTATMLILFVSALLSGIVKEIHVG